MDSADGGASVIVDGVVTHDEVLPWLSPAVQREWATAKRAREMATLPEQRGWATADEVRDLPGSWIAIIELGQAEPRYIPGGP